MCCVSVALHRMFGLGVRLEEIELFPVQGWLLWNQRNTVLHRRNLQDPAQLVKRARDYLDEYKETQVQLAISTNIVRVTSWSPPFGLGYKLNFDVAIFPVLNTSSFGA